MSQSLRYRPRSIAVVGASPSRFIGRVVFDNCRRLGYQGGLVAVTPRYTEVADVPAVPRLTDLSEPVDVAVVQVRTERVLEIVEDGITAGVKTFVIPGAGTTDSGSQAAALARELQRLQQDQQVAVIGPNCMGVLDLVSGAAPYIGTVGAHLRRGSVGLVAHSGAIVEAFVNAGPRVPLSTAISSGSETVLTFADHLRFFVDDPETTAVLAFVEAIDDGPEALAACRQLAEAGKALGVCLVGHSEIAQKGVQAHSGRLAGSVRTAAAALVQSGAVLAADLDELLNLGQIFGTRRRVAGRRMHLITNSGGEANMLADVASAAGLELPPLGDAATDVLTARWPLFTARNPIDPWGADDHEIIYPEVLRVMAHESTDLLVVGIDQQRTAGEYEKDLGLFLARALSHASNDATAVPVMLSPASQDPPDRLVEFCARADIPLLRGARPGLAVLAALGRRAESEANRDIRTSLRAENPIVEPNASRNAGDAAELPSTEDELLTALGSLGLNVPQSIRVVSSDTAVQAFVAIGGPVVVKGVAEGLLHKTEAGLVAVGLTTAEQVHREAERMLDWALRQDLDLELLVAEMVRGELEVLVGYHRDPTFGATCLVGLGGVWAEYLDVVDIHVGELDEAGASRFLDNSRVGKMMANARGGALDRGGVLSALCAVSKLGVSSPQINAIDVNPIIVGRTRAVAVDAAITVSP
ncbi:acetate--CoA ligase family protein [Mycolicibacterium wolinskyi]|uniref:acetate--CoA ligase family protein n=1 Tax=Mycolicibacterium wolinskyi TaxID=59750 RepID=UPI0039177300